MLRIIQENKHLRRTISFFIGLIVAGGAWTWVSFIAVDTSIFETSYPSEYAFVIFVHIIPSVLLGLANGWFVRKKDTIITINVFSFITLFAILALDIVGLIFASTLKAVTLTISFLIIAIYFYMLPFELISRKLVNSIIDPEEKRTAYVRWKRYSFITWLYSIIIFIPTVTIFILSYVAFNKAMPIGLLGILAEGFAIYLAILSFRQSKKLKSES